VCHNTSVTELKQAFTDRGEEHPTINTRCTINGKVEPALMEYTICQRPVYCTNRNTVGPRATSYRSSTEIDVTEANEARTLTVVNHVEQVGDGRLPWPDAAVDSALEHQASARDVHRSTKG